MKERYKIYRKGEELPTQVLDGVSILTLVDSDFLEILPVIYPPETGFASHYSHMGEETCFVLESSLEYRLGEEKIDLKKGDLIWHPSSIKHGAWNVTKTECLTFYAVSPATFSHPELNNSIMPPQSVPPVVNNPHPYQVMRADECIGQTVFEGIHLIIKTVRPRISALIGVYEPENPHPELYTHEGYENILALEGKMSIRIEKDSIELNAGDAICFPSSLPHSFANSGKERALILGYNIGSFFWCPIEPRIQKIEGDFIWQ